MFQSVYFYTLIGVYATGNLQIPRDTNQSRPAGDWQVDLLIEARAAAAT